MPAIMASATLRIVLRILFGKQRSPFAPMNIICGVNVIAYYFME